MRSGAEMREPIELSFGVVSGVGPGIGVLDDDGEGNRSRVIWDISTGETGRR